MHKPLPCMDICETPHNSTLAPAYRNLTSDVKHFSRVLQDPVAFANYSFYHVPNSLLRFHFQRYEIQ